MLRRAEQIRMPAAQKEMIQVALECQVEPRFLWAPQTLNCTYDLADSIARESPEYPR